MAAEPFVGQIQAFGFDYAPKNWALCQGQILSVTSNQALFALLGTYYGGNGTSNFALPNLQGRAVKGYGQGAGLTACTMGQLSGAETVVLSVANLPAHTHLLTVVAGSGPKASALPGASPEPGTNNTLGELNDPNLASVNNMYNSATPTISLNTGAAAPALATAGSSSPASVMQPFLVVNYCIALTGIFPSRN